MEDKAGKCRLKFVFQRDFILATEIRKLRFLCTFSFIITAAAMNCFFTK